MRSLIGLKNVIMFSVILLTIGSVSAQQAFAGIIVLPELECTIEPTSANVEISEKDGSGFVDKKITCNHDIIDISGAPPNTCINYDVVLIDGLLTGNMLEFVEQVTNSGPLEPEHCEVEWLVETFGGSEFLTQELWITVPQNQPIGGTSFPVSTTSLLVAGAQANMGLLSLALVGIVGAGAAIIYKTKSKKTEQ